MGHLPCPPVLYNCLSVVWVVWFNGLLVVWWAAFLGVRRVAAVLVSG